MTGLDETFIGPGRQYRLLTVLGRGGAGHVYEAEHIGLQRRVAIKILDATLTRQEDFVRRFQLEARSIAQLDHPNILPVFDFGEDNGRFYLVMRLVRGGSLGSRLRAARAASSARPVIWTPAETVVLARQILAAIGAAHRQGVIHRDLKPDNILIDTDDVTGGGYRAFLADFGLAKLVHGELGLTQTGALLGTPAYMSPEQVLGRGIDGRADLYAFGVILYELLTGRVPFTGTTPIAIAVAHLQTPLPSPRVLAPALPEPFARVLEQSLSKEPEGRFATGAALMAALEQAMQDAEQTIGSAPRAPRPSSNLAGEKPPPRLPPADGARRPARVPPPSDAGPAPRTPRFTDSRRGLALIVSAAIVGILALGVLLVPILGNLHAGDAAAPTPSPTQLPVAVATRAPNTPAGVASPTSSPSPAPLAAPVSPPAPPPTLAPVLAGTIKIVSSLPRTGGSQPSTDAIVEAVKQALGEVDYRIGNATLVYEDLDDAAAATGRWDATREADNARKAASDPDVMVYLGTLDSSASAVSIPILCKANLVMISPANTYPGLSKKIDGVQPNEPDVYYPDGCPRNFARVLPTSEIQGAASAAWAKQLGATKAYVLTNAGEAFGVSVSRTYVEQAGRVGLTIVGGPEALPPLADDSSALMQKIKERNPDTVYFAGSVNDNMVRLWQDLRRTLGPDVRLMGPSTFAVDPSWMAKVGDAAEGTYVTFPTVAGRLLNGKGADWYRRYKQQIGREPDDYAAYAYDATTAALEAIRRTGRKDRAAIRDAVFATRDFDGLLGKWSFAETGDTTSMTMGGSQVRKGQIDDTTSVAVRPN